VDHAEVLGGQSDRIVRFSLAKGEAAMVTQNDEAQVKTAAGIVWFIAGLNLLVGLAATILQIELLLNLGFGWYSIVFGLILVVLGFFVSRRSVIALILAIVIFAVDALLGVSAVIAAGGRPAVGGFVFRAMLIYFMIRAVGSMRRLNRGAPAPSVQSPSMSAESAEK
jgi:hypothetical protein